MLKGRVDQDPKPSQPRTPDSTPLSEHSAIKKCDCFFPIFYPIYTLTFGRKTFISTPSGKISCTFFGSFLKNLIFRLLRAPNPPLFESHDVEHLCLF